MGLAKEMGLVQKGWVQEKEEEENLVMAMVVALDEEMKEPRMGQTEDLVRVIEIQVVERQRERRERGRVMKDKVVGGEYKSLE